MSPSGKASHSRVSPLCGPSKNPGGRFARGARRGPRGLPVALLVAQDEDTRQVMLDEMRTDFIVLQAGSLQQALSVFNLLSDVSAVVTDIDLGGRRRLADPLLDSVRRQSEACVRILVHEGGVRPQDGVLIAHGMVRRPWQQGELLSVVRRRVRRLRRARAVAPEAEATDA
eukprot:GHVR01162783.1.p3 GENE.GHVR01162783.1~~GHVR01162783.1.p3  ORF type:complete len:171 (-),score=29.18 GHVR01162783.1:270-782(-)